MAYLDRELLLRETLDKFHKLNTSEFDQFLEVCEFKSYNKKSYLLELGDLNKGIHYIISGVVGLFEIIDSKEMFQNFYLQGEFGNELKSLTTGARASKYMIALEPTETFFLNRKKLLALYEKSNSFEKLGRKLLEHILNKQNEISYILQSKKPEDRYHYLQEHRPELLQKVALTYLASYIGITRETLSRIRAKK